MTITSFHNAAEFPTNLRGGVVAIGNFDGMHRGHQAVLLEALKLKQAHNSSLSILTFEPHPRSFFKPFDPVFRLTNSDLKSKLSDALGVDAIHHCEFNAEFSSKTAEEFLTDNLVGTFGAKHVVVGYDFHFGKDRKGSPSYLLENAPKLGLSAAVVEKFCGEDAEVISSTRIRECLSEGDLAQANGLLGYSFRVSGEVIKGAQLGRTLGYPTANLSLPEEVTLKHGIYAVRVELPDGKRCDGVASFGRRPTFDNAHPLLEAFIFDFDGDLYGKTITIFLESYLRQEEKFDSAEALVEQMDLDSAEAKNFLSMMGPEEGVWPIVQY